MPKTVNQERPADGEVLFDTDEKLFEDLKAQPGEKAFVFIHTLPDECPPAGDGRRRSRALRRYAMDTVADLGGHQEYGTVALDPPDDPPFHEDWERRAFAMALLSMRLSGTNLDAFRNALNRQHP